MSRYYKCAIVGCGKIAGGYDSFDSSHVRTHAKAFLDHPDCKLMLACDINRTALTAFCKEWRVDNSYSSLEEMLSKHGSTIDILSICSPTPEHLEQLKLSSRFDIPYIWLEKPCFEDLTGCVGSLQAVNKSTSSIFVNYFRRYDKGFLELKKRLLGLGSIERVNAFYTKGLRNNGSHLIDTLRWLLGDNLEVTNSTLEDFDDKYPTYSFDLRNKLDGYTVSVKGLDYQRYEAFEIDIWTSHARVRILDGGKKIEYFSVQSSRLYAGYDNLVLSDEHSGSYSFFMRAGLRLLLDKDDNVATLKDEHKLLRIIEAIEQKA